MSIFSKHSSLPKVGLRPTIDGRFGGVRESLESQTMEMAKAAAQLISSTLRYPHGEPVQCVVADTTIGALRKPLRARRSLHARMSACRSR